MTWNRIARKGPETFGAAVHPKRPDWVYMCLTESAPGPGLWLSKDAGKSWKPFLGIPFRNIQRVGILVDGQTSVPIQIDLNRAKRDMTGRENIIIQPGDYLYLQYTCLEGVGAFFERHLLEGALFGLATAQFTSNGN